MAKNKEKQQLLKIKNAVHLTLEKLEKLLLKDKTDEDYIHRIRVHIKHLRAWLRFLRIKLDELHWKKMDRQLGDLARSLGRARDMQVIAETLDIFGQRTENADEQQLLIKLGAICKDQEMASKIDWAHFKFTLNEQLATYREYYTQVHSANELRNDLKRQYIKTIELGQRAYANDHDFRKLHKFRKNIKALNYQVGYLNKGFQNKGKKIKSRLDDLGELLGKIHDLDILRQHMNALPEEYLDNSERNIAEQILERELQQLLRDSYRIYENMLDIKPENFARFIK